MKSKYLQEDMVVLADTIHELGFGGSTLLVTGATGLIGSLCVRAAVEHNRQYKEPVSVIAMVRSEEKAKRMFDDELSEAGAIPHVRYLIHDIMKPLPDALVCDYIIHTANSTSSKFFITNPVDVIESIYLGTKNVLSYAAQHPVSGVVYLSSMEVYGRVDTDVRVHEDDLGYLDIQNVRSCYSEGKRHAELLCKCYAVQHSVPVTVARLAQTFGAGIPATENRVFAQFARSAIQGENIVLHTKGLSVGNYCYTRDTVRALFLLLKRGERGESYNVVNEETTRTIADMAKMVAEKFSNGRSQVVFDIPEGNEYGYAPDTQLRLCADKIKALGWQAKVGLEEMYKRMIPDLQAVK